MKILARPLHTLWLLALAGAAVCSLLVAPPSGHAVDADKHPAATTPALTPAEAQKRFVVPKGFELRLFAAEPEVKNPVAMSWDERGRLWVLELHQYPNKAKAGERGKDLIKILEDTNNDGRADKVTVFADGLDMATGLLVGRGGVFVGQAPDLLFLRDTNGDDRADERTVLLTGFAFADTHETLNGFTWGPDGWMYFTHGVFNYSNVRPPGAADSEGNPFDAVVARYHPERKLLEVFADGTSNPWGVDFDRGGNAFVSACVIDHLFHISPGGVYVRQAGAPRWPYAYDLLPSIVDHRHFRAAFAGVQFLEGDQFPAAYRGQIIMGNIHGNSVNRDRLVPRGASFLANAEEDLIKTNDGWFRPVSEQIGPDGALWIADWYDKYPCYQNAIADPQGVDRTRGRIWRLVYTGDKAGAPRPSARAGRPDLKRLATAELVGQLAHDNVWQRKVAQRVLTERRDPTSTASLVALARGGKAVPARLSALWTLHAAGFLQDDLLDALATDGASDLRVWSARLTGERNDGDADGARAKRALPRLLTLAGDVEPNVRAAVAVAARRMADRETDAILLALLARSGPASGGVSPAAEGEDRLLGFLLWRAIEPRLLKNSAPYAKFIAEQGAAGLPYSGRLLRYLVRRLFDSGDPAKRVEAIAAVGAAASKNPELAREGLRGLIEAKPDAAAGASLFPLLRTLAARPEAEVGPPARALAARLGDRAAQAAMLAIARGKAPAADRLAALEVLADAGVAGTEALCLTLLTGKDTDLAVAAVRALGKLGSKTGGRQIAARLGKLAPVTRAAAIAVLASRPLWTVELVTAIERKTLAASDVPSSLQGTLRKHSDAALAARALKLFGNARESSDEKLKLIDDKHTLVMNGAVDFADGRAQAEKTCLLCHKFFGTGAEVAPDLAGVGRSTLQALLTNVIDPNQIIGKGYEQVTVTTKDGRLISGRLMEDTAHKVTLAGMNQKETIARKDIAAQDVSNISVMPEGLEGLPDENFRNLIWYVFAPPHDPANKIRVEPRGNTLAVLVRAPGKAGDWIPLLDYSLDKALRPFIHPLRDPSGTITLTDNKPADHVWQHGVFTGLHEVNGLDFWSEKASKQHFVRLTDVRQEPDRVGWKSLTDWNGPDGKVVVQEIQDFTVFAPASSDGYEIDFEWTLRAAGKPVKIGRYDYGGLAVRMPFADTHHHLNSNGLVDKKTSEDRAAWTTTERAFGSTVWGIAIFDHPSNPKHPAQWRVDAQGLINPSRSLQGDWALEPKSSTTQRYRLVVYKGPADAKKLNAAFARYAAAVVAGR